MDVNMSVSPGVFGSSLHRSKGFGLTGLAACHAIPGSKSSAMPMGSRGTKVVGEKWFTMFTVFVIVNY